MTKGMRGSEPVLGKWPKMLELWNLGYDTYEIAQLLELREHQVYNRLSTIRHQLKWLIRSCNDA